MAQYVILGQVGKFKYYLTKESNSYQWSESFKDALIFESQSDANDVIRRITNEPEELMIDLTSCKMPHYDAPHTLRLLAGLNIDKKKADIKLSVCCFSPIPLSFERWHVEDGRGKTKRLN